MKRIVLIDGKNFCFRMHYTHRSLRSEGRPTSVLYGVLAAMLSVAKKIPSAPLVFVWDGGSPTWRHELSGGTYKAHRKRNPDTISVMSQIPILCRFLDRMGFHNLAVPHLEGDDLVGILCSHIRSRGIVEQVVIHSTDRDFYQLLSSPFVSPSVVILGSDSVVTAETVKRRFNVDAEDWHKFLALKGDSGDGIPPARRGIGPKTAVKLLAAGLDPSLPSFLAQVSTMRGKFRGFKKDWAGLYRNYKLTTILNHRTSSFYVPTEVQSGIDHQLSGYQAYGSFLRRSNGMTEERYLEMIRFFSEYEMQELIGRRFEFWRLL